MIDSIIECAWETSERGCSIDVLIPWGWWWMKAVARAGNSGARTLSRVLRLRFLLAARLFFVFTDGDGDGYGILEVLSTRVSRRFV